MRKKESDKSQCLTPRREYHGRPYDKDRITGRVDELLADPQVTDKRGIFEYILGGEADRTLLNVRVFYERTKRSVYEAQTNAATTEVPCTVKKTVNLCSAF